MSLGIIFTAGAVTDYTGRGSTLKTRRSSGQLQSEVERPFQAPLYVEIYVLMMSTSTLITSIWPKDIWNLVRAPSQAEVIERCIAA